MLKVIKKNASLAFVLLLSIPVCASQHDTAESIKKVSQSNAIAAAFSAIFAKSGVKTAGQNAFAWASRTVPSWQTMRQAPRAGLALVKRGTSAVVNAGRHASSCVVPYVRPVVNFTHAHPRMTQVAVGSLFATGLTYALLKVVKHWKAHHPATVVRALPAAEAVQVEGQEAAGLGLDAKLPRKATRPKGTFRVPSKYQQHQEQEPAVEAAAAHQDEVLQTTGTEQPQQMSKGKQHVQEETAAVTAPSLEDAGQHINQQKEEIALVKAAKEKIITTHKLLAGVFDAAEVYINVLAKENVSRQEVTAASENYFKVYTNAFDYSISAVPERLKPAANRYNEICAKILDICSEPRNFENVQKKTEIGQLWKIVKTEIFLQFKEDLQKLEETLAAIEMSLQR
ncbi:MAG TPA: hypothetical protein PKD74_04000 [Candidatus Dependentiae bacterium]|nr:hypothetical protein [Candidatus Dependentiae bacterium]